MKKSVLWVVFAMIVVAVFSEVGWRSQGIKEGKAIAKKGFESQQAIKIFTVGDLTIGYAISGETDPKIKKAVDSTMEQLSLGLGRALAAAEAYGRTLDVDLIRARILGNKDVENLILQIMEDTAERKTGGLSGPRIED